MNDLDSVQKEFIRKKVLQLGSLDSVHKFYPRDCLVDKFAREMASELYTSQVVRPNEKTDDYSKSKVALKADTDATEIEEKKDEQKSTRNEKPVITNNKKRNSSISNSEDTDQHISYRNAILKSVFDKLTIIDKQVLTKYKENFAYEEYEYLISNLELLRSLHDGYRDPQNGIERHFISVFLRKENIPKSKNEITYDKYLKYRQILTYLLERSTNKSTKLRSAAIADDTESRRLANAEAAYRMAKERQAKEKNIPENEEGYPTHGWFTDSDLKKMRSQDYADMKKHHKE